MKSLSCAHCGLPVYGQNQKHGGEDRPTYCCNGCAIVASMLGTVKEDVSAEARQSRTLFLRIGLAAFFSANTMVLSLFLYSLERPGAAADVPGVAIELIRGLLLCFSAPVFVLLAPPYLAGLGRDLRRLRFSMESLIAIGAASAFLYSAFSVLRRSGNVYFDTAAMVLMLVTVGRLIETNAKFRGRRAVLELMELQPPTARVWREEGWAETDARSVEPGARVQVLSGERIPVDGRIVRGSSAIDESMLTGEPLPAERGRGEIVRAGSLCLNGVIEISTSEKTAASLLSRIISSVEEAQRLRSPIERLADRISTVLVPLTISVALAVTAYWWTAGTEKALLTGLSVLVVACPCALGIAIPMVNILALSAAAKRGILVRSSETLERLAAITTVVFDKTGTVTRGEVEVKRIVPVPPADRSKVLATAAAAAADSLHPVSQAIRRLAESEGLPLQAQSHVELLPGKGVAVQIEGGSLVLLGQPKWVESRVTEVPADWRAQVAESLDSVNGMAWCAADGQVLGALLLEDPVSEEAKQVTARLRELGLRLALLSGDRDEVVQRAASLLSMQNGWGELLPEEKAIRIREIQRAKERVVMVGDGINDAPALAVADVGLAVSNGTEVAREVAEVAFLEGGLWKLPQLLLIARQCRRIGRQNLAWTFGYNAVALALAAAGLLQPIWAATTMLASSLVVTGNSLRLNATIGRRDHQTPSAVPNGTD